LNSTGSNWSEGFVAQFADKEFRDLFVAEQVRVRAATMIRTLREQRGWTQKELADRMGTSQSVISRIEDADYGKLSVQTLLDVAAACDLPVFIDLPEWPDWFECMRDFSAEAFQREAFNPEKLVAPAPSRVTTQRVTPLSSGATIVSIGTALAIREARQANTTYTYIETTKIVGANRV
jgi:transcriptional regulator with XRE-family HTH domain